MENCANYGRILILFFNLDSAKDANLVLTITIISSVLTHSFGLLKIVLDFTKDLHKAADQKAKDAGAKPDYRKVDRYTNLSATFAAFGLIVTVLATLGLSALTFTLQAAKAKKQSCEQVQAFQVQLDRLNAIKEGLDVAVDTTQHTLDDVTKSLAYEVKQIAQSAELSRKISASSVRSQKDSLQLIKMI